jgi:hypothetical protein
VDKRSPILVLLIIISAGLSCSTVRTNIDKPFEAAALAKEYALDIEKSNKKFKGEYLTVIGEVWQTYTNKFNENIIILMPKEGKYGVKCFLSTTARPLEKPLKQGEIIKVNGKCHGFEDFVILKGCILLKN